MSLTAIVVTHNSAGRIDEALASVARVLPEAELLVVDNASSDATVERVQADGRATLLRRPENSGFGRACNAGAEAARGRHLLFLNPDVQVVSADAPALAHLLRADPFGAVGAANDLPGGRRSDGLRAGSGLGREILSHTVGFVRPRELGHGPPRVGGSRPWVSGAALLVRRDEFLGLGGFDPRFFLYHEDRELCDRYRAASLPVRSTPALVVHHAGGRSSGDDDLRVVPAAWELLSWIEYLHGRDGPRTARRAARVTVAALRCLSGGLAGLSRFGLPPQRARRKAEQLAALLVALRDLRGPAARGGFCPNALEHLRPRR